MINFSSHLGAFVVKIPSDRKVYNLPMKIRWAILFFFLTACTTALLTPHTPTPSPTPTYTSIPPTHTLRPFETPPPSPTPVPTVRFAVIGDYGRAGDPLAAVAALVDSWQVDFIITTGDNNYPLGEASTIDENIGQYFHAYIYPYQGEYGPGAEVNRFFPSMGNHDWYSQNGQPYLDYFTLPGNERYYDFQWDFIHFFVLSSDWQEPDGISKRSAQAAWLQEALAASTAPWKVIYFHHAPYASGYHRDTAYMQWPFKEWGADVVLSGHDHIYERLLINGLTYFVNGLGGGARYAITAPHTGSQVRYQARHGAMLVEATPTQMTFQFIDIDGDIIDEYILSR
jgi:tartrate-resistant acid phosphatase type 5